MTDLVSRCRSLADLHGGTDLADRVRHALEDQRLQRGALAEAANEIERLRAELQEARAAVVASTAQAATRAPDPSHQEMSHE